MSKQSHWGLVKPLYPRWQDEESKKHNEEVRKVLEERKRAVREERAASSGEDKKETNYDLTDYDSIKKQINQEKEEYLKRKKEEIIKNKAKNIDTSAIAYSKGQNQRG